MKRLGPPRLTPRAEPAPSPVHGRLAPGSSEEAKLGIGGETGQPVVILILIAVLWLSVTTAVIGACQVAALGDAAEDDLRARREGGAAGPGRASMSAVSPQSWLIAPPSRVNGSARATNTGQIV